MDTTLIRVTVRRPHTLRAEKSFAHRTAQVVLRSTQLPASTNQLKLFLLPACLLTTYSYSCPEPCENIWTSPIFLAVTSRKSPQSDVLLSVFRGDHIFVERHAVLFSTCSRAIEPEKLSSSAPLER